MLDVPRKKDELGAAGGKLMEAAKTKKEGVICFGILDKGKKLTSSMGLVWSSIVQWMQCL